MPTINQLLYRFLFYYYVIHSSHSELLAHKHIFISNRPRIWNEPSSLTLFSLQTEVVFPIYMLCVKISFVFRWKICEKNCFWILLSIVWKILWTDLDNCRHPYESHSKAETCFFSDVNIFVIGVEFEATSPDQEKLIDKVNLMGSW